MAENLTGLHKAAIIMMALNNETATKIFSMLEDDEIREISHAMTSVGNVAPEIIEALITEFHNEVGSSMSLVGNLHNTERMLRKILDDDKVESILEDIRGPAGKNIWDKLSNVNEEVLANYLKNEYPQTAALILSKLAPNHAANVLKILNSEFAFEVMRRMLMMDPVKKEILDKVEKTLRNEFISGLTKTQKADTNQMMAEIFNNFDRSTESRYMTMLEKDLPDAAERIKKLMFTFDNIGRIDASGIQAIIKAVDKAKLPIAMKGASEEMRKKFLDNMSQRAAKILQEEMESLGPVRIKDVDEAQAAIIGVARDLIAKGEVMMSEGGGDDQLIY
jgi:flagellar motor switch protein FliG